MKDFSLLYGPARKWAVIVGTIVMAVAIGLFAQGRSSGQQEIQAETSAERSSSQSPRSEPQPAAPAADDQPEDVSESAEEWSRAPQSAADIPFVSLKPSPEEITEAGKELIDSNTSTTVRSTPATAGRRPVNPAEPDPPRTTTPSPEPVSNPTKPDEPAAEPGNDGDGDSNAGNDDNDAEADDDGAEDSGENDGGEAEQPQPETTQPPPETTQPPPPETTPPTEAAPRQCQASGNSRLAAIINYVLTCSVPRQGCDRVDDGGWICFGGRQ